ncbi:MarR family transcriptional regulator [Paenibacillus sp. KQZ6P-2]|uniref:MarR family transcriptional regulator n=1 Tax=Paenibacillus mangrovi TaxID=2931978 RepID=A0A9X1WUT6_9BACL|nr:MarR family transcriptional regulator [Paenibacillus mangrovi]MCJ8013978.1 MarR family transcriptional regulator [Paenibacillus mangrovi]
MQTEKSQARQLLEAMTKIRRIHSRAGHDAKIPRGEYLMMHVIWEFMSKKHTQNNSSEEIPPGMKVSELSEYLKISSPSVSQMVNALEEKGYVERVMTKNDRRVVYICLTEQGKLILEKVTQQFMAFTDEIIDRLGKEETDQLIHLFNRLYTIIGDIKDEKSSK